MCSHGPLFILSRCCFEVFVYLALPGFSCGTCNLYLQHVGSGSLTKDGTRPSWEHAVLATAPPGKSPLCILNAA